MSLSPLDRQLISACIYCNPDSARDALLSGANPNVKNMSGATPLLFASRKSPLLTQILLLHGADPNLAAPDGTSPAMNAVAENQIQCISLLADHGADLLARDLSGEDARRLQFFDAAHFILARLACDEKSQLQSCCPLPPPKPRARF